MHARFTAEGLWGLTKSGRVGGGKLNKSYPLLETKVQETGEHIEETTNENPLVQSVRFQKDFPEWNFVSETQSYIYNQFS